MIESFAHRSMDLLGSLVGDWVGQYPSGTGDEVSYRFTGGGTALVESWVLVGGKEAMTVYHLDGDDLIAAHYCPWGNFPRLRLRRRGKLGEMKFEFFDGLNLHNPDNLHQHAFWLTIHDANLFERSECYIANDSQNAGSTQHPTSEVGRYRRKEF